MRLDNLDDITNIANKTSFAIFEIPAGDFAELFPKAYHVKPNEKGIITVNEIRSVTEITNTKQSTDLIIVIEEAETMNEEAANAFLKNLEEPGDHVHYVFLIRNSTSIMPTVKSRAHCYYLASTSKISDKPDIDSKILALAKSYISATPQQLPKLAADIAKDKQDARSKAIAVVDASIQLLFKSYFVTGNNAYLTKLDKLMATSEALKGNGNIKLQLVAGML